MRWILLFLLILNGVVYWWYNYESDSHKLMPSGVSEPHSALVNSVTPKLVLLSEKTVSENTNRRPLVIGPDEILVVPESSKETVFDASGPVADDSGGIASAEAVKPAERVCGMLGPFDDVITARQLRYRLSTVDIAATLKKETVPIDPVYWVYLEPLASRKEALSVLRKLQSAKIDSYIITEGELANGLSLGFFKQKESAEKIMRKRIDDGFDAKLLLKERSRDSIWVVLEPQEMEKVSEELIKSMSADFKFIQTRQNLCEHVASLANIE
jgi:hypothetical protein